MKGNFEKLQKFANSKNYRHWIMCESNDNLKVSVFHLESNNNIVNEYSTRHAMQDMLFNKLRAGSVLPIKTLV